MLLTIKKTNSKYVDFKVRVIQSSDSYGSENEQIYTDANQKTDSQNVATGRSRAIANASKSSEKILKYGCNTNEARSSR